MGVYDKEYARLYDQIGVSFTKDDIDLLLTTYKVEHPFLDLCCGTGLHLHHLSKAVSPDLLIGQDISPAMLEIARKRSPDIYFCCANALDGSVWNQETFGAISIFCGSIHELKNEMEMYTLFLNCYNWIMGSGLLLMSYYSILNPDLSISDKKYFCSIMSKGSCRYLFEERIKDENDKWMARDHYLFIPPISLILSLAESVGFKLIQYLPRSGFEHWIVLGKPNG